jgi:protein tyrosine phosphatase
MNFVNSVQISPTLGITAVESLSSLNEISAIDFKMILIASAALAAIVLFVKALSCFFSDRCSATVIEQQEGREALPISGLLNEINESDSMKQEPKQTIDKEMREEKVPMPRVEFLENSEDQKKEEKKSPSPIPKLDISQLNQTEDASQTSLQPTEVPDLPVIDYAQVFSRLRAQTKQLDIAYETYDSEQCRFGDVLCPLETKVEGLNGNRVNLAGLDFIATQYPLFAQFDRFWKVAEQASLVVDLTNGGDMKKGLFRYFPIDQQTQELFTLNVANTLSENRERFVRHEYTISDAESKPIGFVKRVHYEGWDDMQGAAPDDLDALLKELDLARAEKPSAPVVIHCRAGIGRTGTIIVASALLKLIREGKVDGSNWEDHISSLILEGRKQRGLGFVQTPLQLQAIYQWAWIAIHLNRN